MQANQIYNIEDATCHNGVCTLSGADLGRRRLLHSSSGGQPPYPSLPRREREKGKRREKKEKEGRGRKGNKRYAGHAAVSSPPPTYVAYFLQPTILLVVDSGTQGRKPWKTGDGPPQSFDWRTDYLICPQQIITPLKTKKHF